MFYTQKDDDSSFEEIKVDNKIFYKKKMKPIKKKRYSDQFKDPLFIEKDKFRKLKMIERFRQNSGEIDDKIEKYRECIEKCIYILNNDMDIPIKMLFQIFNLNAYGFKLDDFGVYEEIEEKSNENE